MDGTDGDRYIDGWIDIFIFSNQMDGWIFSNNSDRLMDGQMLIDGWMDGYLVIRWMDGFQMDGTDGDR